MTDPLDEAPANLNTDLLNATIELIGRTGAKAFRLGWVDEEPELPQYPHIWYATARYEKGHEAAAAMDPVGAVTRLAEQLIDGGKCQHCSRPTAIHQDSGDAELERMIRKATDTPFCWYWYDYLSKSFKRGCE